MPTSTDELDIATSAPDGLERIPFGEDPPDRVEVSRVEAIPFTVTAKGEGLPLALNATGNGSEKFPVFGSGITDPEAAQHPFDGRCKVCECPLDDQWRNCDQRASDGRWLFRGYRAINCCAACYETAKKDPTLLRSNLKYWERVCPDEFRTPWDNRLGNGQLLARVLQFDPSRRRGLVIHGKSDAAKTRAAWQLLRKLSENGHEWLFIEAIDLLDNIPAEAFTVPILVIDDLGNDVLTPAKEVKLLKLLRTRCNWHRPVIVTTQFVGESLEKRFVETATAHAVIRRLRQFCDDVHATAVPVRS